MSPALTVKGQGKTIADTRFAATLLMKSKTLSSDFQRVPFGDSAIDLLMLFPLYGEEYAFKRAAGIEGLSAELDAKDVPDIVDVMRVNACATAE